MQIRSLFRRQSCFSSQSEASDRDAACKPEEDDQRRMQGAGIFAKENGDYSREPEFAFPNRPPMWNSIWLRKRTLLSISVIYIACAISLIVLWILDRRHDGFTLLTTNHFSWTYGPTAIMVFIVAVWRQVDQSCKILAPWVSLKTGDAPPSKSVLLDYISPFQLEAFILAVKNRHLDVQCTIFGFTILKLITLVSTGLFFTSATVINNSNVDLTFKSRLDATTFNSTSSDQFVSDSSFFYTAYAIMTKGLVEADGVQGGILYETFTSPTGSRQNTTISADVDVFVPSYTCEPAEVTVNLQPANTTDQNPIDTFNLIKPSSCNLLVGAQPAYALNPQEYKCPPRQLSGVFQNVNCTGPNVNSSIGSSQLLTMVDMRYNQTVVTDDPDSSKFEASSWETVVANITAVVCHPNYTIQRRKVTYDFTQDPAKVTLEEIPDSTNRTLPQFGIEDLMKLFSSSYIQAALMFGSKTANGLEEEYPDTMFSTMAQVINGTYVSLLNPSVMSSAAEEVFRHVAVQIAAKHISKPESQSLIGSSSITEEKLHIRELFLWLMVSGFLLSTVITLIVFIFRPKDAVPRNPESLGSVALILGYSHNFESLLYTDTNLGDKGLKKALEGYVFSTSRSLDHSGQSRFMLEASKLNSGYGFVPDPSSKIEWWRPLFIQRRILTAIMLLPLLMIAMLELLQQLSSRPEGIISLSDPESLTSDIGTRFLPALMVLILSTMYNAIDFNITVLAPYQALKKGKELAHRSILSNLLGKLPPNSLFHAIKHRHWSSLASMTAALLGSVLTIIVSGLYTIDNTPGIIDTQVQLVDNFNSKWDNSLLNDSSAAVVSSLVESTALTYPPFTYQDYAFPRLALDSPLLSANGSNAILHMKLPAWRASIECESFPQSQLNVTPNINARIQSTSVLVQGIFDLPSNCPRGGPGGNLSTLEYENSFTFPNGQNSSYIGKLLDLHVGPYSPISGQSSSEVIPFTQADNPAECPSLAFLYGFVDANDMSKTSVTSMVCYQVIQQLQTNISFSSPNLTISAIDPPSVNESTAISITSNPDNATTFPYRIQLHLDDQFALFSQNQFDFSSINGVPPVDNFFQGVIFGRSPIPISSMTNVSEQAFFQGAIQGFYRRYMVQVISSNMRVSINSSNAINGNNAIMPTTVQAQITNVTKPCVRQNLTAKIILQVLLGIMFVCGILATTLGPLRSLVPYNPCTIAGAAALIAGSEMCKTDELDRYENIQYASDRELLRVRDAIWRNRRFELGWWVGRRVSTAPPGFGMGMSLSLRRYGVDIIDQGDEGYG